MTAHALGTSRLVFGMTGANDLGGGIAEANLNVLTALGRVAARIGAAVDVLSLHESARARPDWLPAEISFRAFAGHRWAFSRALLGRAGPGCLYLFDHVHLAVPLIPLLALGLARMVLFAHGSEASRRLRPSSRWLYRHAALCLANSSLTMRRMREAESRLRVAECALGLSPRHALNTSPPRGGGDAPVLESLSGVTRPIGPRMILMVARMLASERAKGHYRLLDAWPEVLAEFPDAQLVLAGSGDDRGRIAGHACGLGVQASVFMPGFVPHEMLGRLYASCYAFVMPSLQEGFGLVFLEAMNLAKPCVGCAGDGAECVIADGETGYLLDNPGDRAELRAVLLGLLGCEERARAMGRNGLRRLNEQFTAAHAQQRIVDRLSEVM